MHRMSRAHECLQDATESRHVGLPYRKPMRTWAGRGTGAPCRACGGPIGADQIEYEVELEPSATERPVLRMHLECYQSWATRT